MTDDVPRLLKLAEVAAMFRVHRATVARWKGLTVVRTPGGDRRYLYDEVLAYLDFGAAPKIFPSGVGGESAPDGKQERPAAGAAEALQPTGRKEGAGAPRRFGGVAEAGSCAPAPQASEGGRQ